MTIEMPAVLRRLSPASIAGFVAVVLARALTLPRSLWEMDEVLFARAVERFDPLSHRPHPPGYPLLVGLGKAFNLVFHDPFTSLVALSFVSTLVGYWALVAAFRRIAGGPDAERVAVAGALLFHLSPAMLVQAPLPMSDPPALMFLSLALAAAAILREEGTWKSALGLGVAASAAVGCRPQLALAVLPMLAAALAQAPGWRRRGEALAAFTLVSLLWFVPLVTATGGPRGLVEYQMKQASYVATHDATVSRGDASTSHVARRFINHPWGRKQIAFPVLALAVAGATSLALRRRFAALPLAVLSLLQLAVCLKTMDPADGVRYALPVVLGVAFTAMVGAQALARLSKVPAAIWIVPLAVGTAAFVYAWPVLSLRTRMISPPVSAIRWAGRNIPPKSVILVGEDMAPHADYLLKGFDLAMIEDGFTRAAKRPGTQTWLLIEGRGRWPGTVFFRWPFSDAYPKLTRNHYRVASLIPVPRERCFQSVRGVYAWEPSLLDARWRWLEPAADLRIFPRKGCRIVKVKLALDPSAPIPSNTVTVSLNGGPGTAVEVPRGGTGTVHMPLPPTRPIDIAIRSARSFDPPGPDSRRLAVQLLAVERISH